ncbi:hypothetical protein AGLY_002726 [Aphis glycines]|uniref:Uncharacterized protein n=1 Tax=Aphis glycines TaxID=307491 RepID=A0A6G0U143_APHGL|nr:hypothetical protein AGLY_002726 [Aphis glycines]
MIVPRHRKYPQFIIPTHLRIFAASAWDFLHLQPTLPANMWLDLKVLKNYIVTNIFKINFSFIAQTIIKSAIKKLKLITCIDFQYTILDPIAQMLPGKMNQMMVKNLVLVLYKLLNYLALNSIVLNTLLLAVMFFITSPKFLRSLRLGAGISLNFNNFHTNSLNFTGASKYWKSNKNCKRI